MKYITRLFFLSLLVITLSSCDEELLEDDEEPERTTELITVANITQNNGCLPVESLISFAISYRDVQVIVDVSDNNEAYINVLVEDREEINIVVKRNSDDTTLSNTNVSVRTSSRPSSLDNTVRTLSYCEPFNLIKENF